MGRRKRKQEVDKKAIIEAFSEMVKSRNIDRDLLQGILEETISMLIRKRYGMEARFDIIVNMEKGDIEIYLTKTVVEEVNSPETEISVEEVKLQSGEDYSVGDEYIEEITLETISESFGRRLVVLASQNLNQKIKEIEKDNIYNEFKDKVGEVVIGEIYQIRRNDILVMHNKVEMRLPKEEQIPNEPYRMKKNHTLKAIIKEVRRSGQSGHPEIILSRSSDEFLERLFEIEIPEIYDGIIQIKGIARDAGERSKVAVISFDDRIDPVGACVGMKGIRIHSIVRELNNENIDLIQYSEVPEVYIARALSPAKAKEIQISAETRSATVIVPDDQVSLAIGKNGQNVRLASKLTGYSLTLIKEGGEDIDLTEFKEEFGHELFSKLTASGIETAREFLECEPEILLAMEGMNKDLLLELRKIVLSEFEEEESDEVVAEIEQASKKLSGEAPDVVESELKTEELEEETYEIEELEEENVEFEKEKSEVENREAEAEI